MLDAFFDKGQVRGSTFHPEKGDTFWMDLDRNNFPEWRNRQPKADSSDTAIRAAVEDLEAAIEGEFEPLALESSPARALTYREKALVDNFRRETLRSLAIISGGGPNDDEETDLSGSGETSIAIEASDYRFSRSLSALFSDKETGSLSQLRVIVGLYRIEDTADVESDRCWIIPDVPGHNSSAEEGGPGAAPPERFRSGPVAFAHVLRSVHGRPDTLDDALLLRFSEPAFREAIEHFVGKHAGVSEMRDPYSHVDFAIRSALEAAHGTSEIEIDAIELVENRENGTIYHFTLAVAVDGEPKVEDVGVFYTANGTIEVERLK